MTNFQIVLDIAIALNRADLLQPLISGVDNSIEGFAGSDVDLHGFSLASVGDEYVVSVAILKDVGGSSGSGGPVALLAASKQRGWIHWLVQRGERYFGGRPIGWRQLLVA